MLPKDRRLTRRQFWLVSQTGRQIAGRGWVIKYLPNGLAYSRWAIVTSAKLDKRAVVRNQLRRRLSSRLRLAEPGLPVDVIIFPRAAMLNLSHAQIESVVSQMVSKISGLVKRA